MRIIAFITILLTISSCTRPFYVKSKYFNCAQKEYIKDSDLKELVYLSIEKAVVTDKDIPDYRLIWNKSKIYISNSYSTYKMNQRHNSKPDWEKYEDEKYYLKNSEIPSKIGNVEFCLKSKKALKTIANKSDESFLYLSFDYIIIEKNKAKIKIENSWVIPDKTKNVMLSGGGYTLLFNKVNGKWIFDKIIGSWIS